MTSSLHMKSVYHSLDSILHVLCREEASAAPEVQELLSLFNSTYRQPHVGQRSRSKAFIVLEGLDASGKSTVSKELAKALNAEMKATPPQGLLPLRCKFDVHPVEMRRAFYSLGNYIAAQEVDAICSSKPVVMDRYWHSTAAYALATELAQGGGMPLLPPPADPVYLWPDDLLRPDCVFFLEVSEDERNKRLSRRHLQKTEEEQELTENSLFRSILLDVYKRMDKPGVTIIDSNRTVAQVVQEIISKLALLPVHVL